MALFNYQKQVQRLLREAKQEFVNPDDILTYINIARGQLAGEGECIRVIATISTVVSQRNYAFSALNTGVSATNGVQGAIHVRRISYNTGSNQKWVGPRPWEWYELYHLNSSSAATGAPAIWSQYAQGSAGSGTDSGSSGSFYIDPPPDQVYVLNCDCVCYPIALVDDSTVEAIPYLWTDAVPFFATYYALLSVANPKAQEDAKRMFEYYSMFVDRARRASNPAVMRWQYEQAPMEMPGQKVAG